MLVLGDCRLSAKTSEYIQIHHLRNIWLPAQSVVRTSCVRILVPKSRKEKGNI